jgi:SNF2 family DNA or RNA helicase
MVRRVVSDVSEAVESMPEEPVHYVHPVKMPEGSEERVVFDALVARLDSAIEAHARTWIILKLYLRIRQFIADPAIYVNAMNREYKGKYTRPAWTGTRSKMAAFRQYMSTTTKVPTIVFTNFREELEEADRILTGLGFRTFSVQGGMSADSRAAAIEESKVAAAAGEPTVILVQIVAGGCGLNLQHCHRVVMLSSHWNPAIVDQAIARAYRMGQSSRVEVHHFVLADDAELNIDRKIASAHGRKRQAAVEVHSKLITESAIEYEALRDILDNSIELPEEDYEGEDPTPVTSTTETTVGMGVAAVAIVAPLASIATVAPMT